ncbi:MAG: hypothetical protein KIT74_02160 [Fimbriimonadales bacterium]|nr:hypothetical protein [Fimbriimonadales bacterium]
MPPARTLTAILLTVRERDFFPIRTITSDCSTHCGKSLLREDAKEENSMMYTIIAIAVAGAAVAGAYSLLKDSLADLW